MKSIRSLSIISVILITIVFLFFACPLPMDLTPSTTQVSLDTGLSLGSRGAMAPTDIASLRLTVSGDDMEAMVKNFSASSIALKVPAGANRLFTLKAFGSDGTLLYQGTATANLEPGASVTIIIDMETAPPSGSLIFLGTWRSVTVDGSPNTNYRLEFTGGSNQLTRWEFSMGSWGQAMPEDLTIDVTASQPHRGSLWQKPMIQPGDPTELYTYEFLSPTQLQVVHVSGSGGPPAGTTILNYDPEFTVSYNLNGAEAGTTPSSATHYAGDQFNLANTTGITKTGATITGWNTQADGSGTHYDSFEGITMPSDNLELYAEWAPLNLALSATATSSSDESATYVASKAIDGDPGTRWASGGTGSGSPKTFDTPQWLQIDLGSSVSFTSPAINLHFEAGSSNYLVQYSSDGSTWTDIGTNRDTPNGGTINITAGLPTMAQYFRILAYTTYGTGGVSLYEFEITDN